MNTSSKHVSERSKGFSLVEVMVALIVCSVGLLGLAKMESLALVSTNVANSRALAALQASSLAAAMHANRGYWATGQAPATTIVDATAANNFSTATNCLAAGSCSPSQMRAYDLKEWGAALAPLLPGYVGTINCSVGGLPVTCTIQIQWVENAVAANAQQTAISGLQTPTYVLYVEP
jgi:type IV pilus assembly protein PilV